MSSEIVHMEGDASMEESDHGGEKVDRTPESMRLYRDPTKIKDTNWDEFFLNWGLNDVEEELVNQLDDSQLVDKVGVEEDNDIPAIEIDSQTRRRIIQPWKNCLIGKVVDKTVGFKYISSKPRELWNPY
ncbi:hypothetical protein MKX01_003384, partial [Papaver californicum]